MYRVKERDKNGIEVAVSARILSLRRTIQENDPLHEPRSLFT